MLANFSKRRCRIRSVCAGCSSTKNVCLASIKKSSSVTLSFQAANVKALESVECARDAAEVPTNCYICFRDKRKVQSSMDVYIVSLACGARWQTPRSAARTQDIHSLRELAKYNVGHKPQKLLLSIKLWIALFKGW